MLRVHTLRPSSRFATAPRTPTGFGRRAPIALLLVSAALLSGCGLFSGTERTGDPLIDIRSDDYATKQQAWAVIHSTDNTDAIPYLIDDLASDDIAVRRNSLELLYRLLRVPSLPVSYLEEDVKLRTALRTYGWAMESRTAIESGTEHWQAWWNESGEAHVARIRAGEFDRGPTPSGARESGTSPREEAPTGGR